MGWGCGEGVRGCRTVWSVRTVLFGSGRISNYKSGLPHRPGEQLG